MKIALIILLLIAAGYGAGLAVEAVAEGPNSKLIRFATTGVLDSDWLPFFLDGNMAKVYDLTRNVGIEGLALPNVFQVGELHNQPGAPIKKANISFNVGVIKTVDKGKAVLQNVVDTCYFHSPDSFEPLCVICKVTDKDGKVVGAGIVRDDKKKYYGSQTIPIKLSPVMPSSNNNGDDDKSKEDDYRKYFDNNDFNKYNKDDFKAYFTGNSFVKYSSSDHSDNNCKCDERKNDHKKHYDDFKKDFDDHKKSYSKGDYKKYLDNFKKYFDDNKEGFDKADFKQYTDYYKKYLDDDKQYFDSGDYKKYDDDYKKYSDEYPKHPDKCNCDDNHQNNNGLLPNDVQKVEGVDVILCAPPCDCQDRKDDHKKHYDDFKKDYDDHKKSYAKGDYKKYIDNYKKYFDDYRDGFDKADFKMYMDNYRKYLDDNKKYFDSGDYKKYDDDYKKYSNEYPEHDSSCKCNDKPPPCDCDKHKQEHKTHYDDFKKDYDDHKKYYAKGDYKNYLNTFKKYFDDNKGGFDKTDFKTYSDYYRKYLDDNKKYFDSGDYKKYDDDYKKYSDEYPQHDDKCRCDDDKPPPPKECKGLSTLTLKYSSSYTSYVNIEVWKGGSKYTTFTNIGNNMEIPIPKTGEKLNESIVLKIFKGTTLYDTINIDATCTGIKEIGYKYQGSKTTLTVTKLERVLGW